MRGWSKVLLRIARISSVHFALSGTAFDTESGEDIDRLQYSFEGKRAIQVVANDVTFSIPVEGLVDFDAEKPRLPKPLEPEIKDGDGSPTRLITPPFANRPNPEPAERRRPPHEPKPPRGQGRQTAETQAPNPHAD